MKFMLLCLIIVVALLLIELRNFRYDYEKVHNLPDIKTKK
jgi:hypothetical protein